jgi:hypothetical protein
MMEWTDRSPDVNVAAERYLRLLGYPRDYEVSGRALELAAWAREWYQRNARPWVYAREAEGVEAHDGAIAIDGATFHGSRMARTFAEANGAVVVAVNGGSEVEEEARKLWSEEKPDEYFFLEVYGSAVVEHLVERAGARLCEWAEAAGRAVLPHYSPGYDGWDVAEQGRLLDLVAGRLPSKMEALDSGALRPKKSQLAVFGLANAGAVKRTAALVPCYNCSFAPCAYRRRPGAERNEKRT